MRSNQKGFTLIELLVVISIIGVLSTIAMTSLNGAKVKARNARKQVDFNNIYNALNVFYATNNRMPNNYHPCCGACEGDGYYERSMQELVDAGVLSAIPKSPDDSKYCYYNYGPDNAAGAIMVTSLIGQPNTTTGPFGSCRPFSDNWCGTDYASNYYCICTTY
ncbi:MAG: type II secretion system protein [Patescibacteria group bacterium]